MKIFAILALLIPLALSVTACDQGANQGSADQPPAGQQPADQQPSDQSSQ